MKKIVSLLTSAALALTMMAGAITTSAEEIQQESIQSQSAMKNDISVAGTNSFGNMISDEFSAKMSEQQENNGCNIFSAEVTEQEVVVSFETTKDCTLVVGIYDEAGVKMLASGSEAVTKGETEKSVIIETENMPEYFYLKAYLVDTYTLSPVCTVYECPNYTQEMQEFLAKTVDDFDSEKVLNLDSDKTNNFAVFNENVKIISSDGDSNKVTTVDEENNKYVIENADSSVTSLKAGDIFAYKYGNGEVLIVNISDIKITDSTAEITGSDTLAEDVFDYIKIDATQDTDAVTLDTSNMSEGVTYNGTAAAKTRSDNRTAVRSTNSDLMTTTYAPGLTIAASEYDEAVDVTFPYTLTEVEIGAAKISGDFEITLGVSLKLYSSVSYRYMELKFNYSAKLSASISGSVDGEACLGTVIIPIIPAVFIDLSLNAVFEAEAKIEVSGTLSGSAGFSYDNDIGISSLNSAPKFKTEFNVEGTVYAGLVFQPALVIISERIADASLSFGIGAEVTAKITGGEDTHACKKCLDGDISGKIGLTGQLEFWGMDDFTYKIDFAEETFKIADFYYSFDYHDGDFTACPHHSHLVEISVYDNMLKPVSNVSITKPMVLQVYGKTDSSGKAKFYLPNGTYTFTAVSNGKKGFKTVTIEDSDVTAAIILNLTESSASVPADVNVNVTVINKDGDPIEGAKISNNENDETFETDSDGIAVMTLPSGEYVRVSASAENYISKNKYFKVSDKEMNVEIKLFKKGSSSSGNNSENVDAAGNVKKISVGYYQNGAITKDGSLYMWGQGIYVDGRNTTSLFPIKIMDNVRDINVGYNCAAAIKEDGSLYVWGSTTIGDGVNTSSDKPIKIMDNVKSVTLGFDANAAITEDGSLYMWGVLDSNSNTVFSPKKIMDNVKDVSFSRQGDYYAAAVTEDGSLYMWGNNGYGQLGNGTTEKSTTPIKIMDNVKSVDLGWHHSGAVTEDGSLYMWGYNFYGQLGNGEYGYTDADHKDMNRIISTPVKVMDNVEEVNLGDLLSSAITKDGSLYTWGTLSYNMVGYDEISNTSYGSPTPKKIMSNVNDLGFGNYHSVALTENGNVYTWGRNDDGQLGNGTTEDNHFPTKINIKEYTTTLENVKALSVEASNHGVITEDGSLYMWGNNGYGQLGNGESGTGAYYKDLVSYIPLKIMDNVKALSLKNRHSGAITEGGSLYMWGKNNSGQLGNGTNDDSSTPVKIMDNVKSVSLGNAYSAAITEDGSLYTWGRNYSGQLGNGTICGEIITPTKIMDNVKSVSLGNTHSAAITEDGNLYTWGYNFYGQLGNGESGYDENGNEIISPTPIKIMGNVKTVSLGDSYSAVITEDGSLYTWGYNKRGQLGNGTNEDSATPIKIMDNVKAVSLGYEHSAAITEDGSLYMWGHNPNGQLGNGTTEGSLNPIKIMENVKSVSLGSNQSGAITEDGSLYMWGLNNCLLGNGTSGGTILTPVKINGISETVNLSTTYSLARNISVLANEEAEKTENTENTKTFTDLEPNTVYNFYVMRTSAIENSLSAENLLYISQGISDENGNLSVSYALTEEGENVEIFVKAMTDEDITSTEGVLGDANGDGKLNVRDAAFIASALAKGESDKLPEAADFNKDGKINVRDAAAIASFLAKKS